MSSVRAYLDYNATSPLRPQARVAMVAVLDEAGNASSVHAEGRRARSIIEDAREKVAAFAGARPSEVVFTSGATEANNWVIAAGFDRFVASGIEHESVLAPVAKAGAGNLRPGVDANGIIQEDTFAAACVGASDLRSLALIQSANNETGVLQPVGDLARVAKQYGLHVHSDAVQAAGRVVLNFRDSGVDTMSLSAHKIGGPKGIGALIVRDGVEVAALLAGGGQERRRRPGTENVSAIAGFGAAAEAAACDLADMHQIAALRDRLEAGVLSAMPGALIIGRAAPRLGNTTCVAIGGLRAETLLIKFDLAGFAVSSGSACSSGKVGASHVLSAIGLADDLAASAVRISIGYATRAEEIDRFLASWRDITQRAALAA